MTIGEKIRAKKRTTLQPLKLQGFSLLINALQVFKCSFSAHCVSSFKHKKQHFIHAFYERFYEQQGTFIFCKASNRVRPSARQ